MTATTSLALPSAVSVSVRIQSQRSQASASFGRTWPQSGHVIVSAETGGSKVGASVYSTIPPFLRRATTPPSQREKISSSVSHLAVFLRVAIFYRLLDN